MKKLFFILLFITMLLPSMAQQKNVIPEKVMKQIYEEVKTPYKYGMVVVPTDNKHLIDCPTIFRIKGKWYMSYIVYDGQQNKGGRGYEPHLAVSDDLLNWKKMGHILSFPDANSKRWDKNQRAGYIALIDYKWGGSYEPEKFDGKYWMSYFGGEISGYERGCLQIGTAYTIGDITKAHEWQVFDKPVLSPRDSSAAWWEKITQYKSFVIKDKKKKLGFPFVMFYNAAGVNPKNNIKAERIGIALSNDMIHWHRYVNNPVIDHNEGITGDGVIQKIDDVYVMFYFGAFWKKRKYGAFNTFACSYDLVHWTKWEGEDLVFPSEEYDRRYAHKSYVIKWNGIVYHFYCAVNENKQRGIALATSQNLGKSSISFPIFEKN